MLHQNLQNRETGTSMCESMNSAIQHARNVSPSEETKLIWPYMLELLENFSTLRFKFIDLHTLRE
jgi:hypothetical protein